MKAISNEKKDEEMEHGARSAVAAADGTTIESQLNADDGEVVAIRPDGIGTRHLQCFMLFTGLLLAYALRVNLSIGIVAMVDNTSNPEFEQYDWNESTRGLLLSSFFWGYIVSQVPAAILAQKYGAKILLLISMGVNAIMTILTPILADSGWEYLCAARVVLGLSQGFIYPSVHTMLARWVHPSERGFLSTCTYSGTQLGTVVMLAASGVIAASPVGWPGIFYISGGLTAVWCFMWLWLASDSPSVAKGISLIEKNFIESTKGCSSSDEKKSTPWKEIFKSKAFWAILVAHSAQNWGFWTLLTEIPTYMKDVLEFDIKENALLSAMPYLVMWILCMVFSEISDFLTNRKYVSVGAGRKLFNSIGHCVPAATLVALGYVTKEHTSLAVALLTISVAVNASSFVGYLINHMDLSPNFAGALMGLTNCASNIMSLLGPIFVGFVVTDATDPALWRIVFFVAAAVFFFGNIVFVIFGSGNIQPWNDAVEKPKVKKISASTNTVETIDIADVYKTK